MRGAFVSCVTLVGSRVALVAACLALARRLYSSATDGRSTWIIIQAVGDVECAVGVFQYAGGRSSPPSISALSLLSFELAARVGAPAQDNHFNELIDSYRNCCIPSELRQSQLLASTPSHRDRYLIEISRPPCTKPDGAIEATSERRPAGDKGGALVIGTACSSDRVLIGWPAHTTTSSRH
jgi:hypothetical protein